MGSSYDSWKTQTPPEYDGGLSETDRLEARIRMLERERDTEHAARVKLEERIRGMSIAAATFSELEAAKVEAKFQRELSHEKLVAALRRGTPDLSPLVDTVVDALEAELAMLEEPWEDLSNGSRRHVAGNIVQAIALDLEAAK